MRFPVQRDVTFFPGGKHIGASEIFDRLPGAVILKSGTTIDIEEFGHEHITFKTEDRSKHQVPTSTFYSAIGSGCFRVSVIFRPEI